MALTSKKKALHLIAAASLLTCGWANASTCENKVFTDANNSASVTTSGDYDSTYSGAHAFDGERSSMWISEPYQSPAWIAYDFGSTTKVDRYSIDFVNGSLTSRAPKDFELQGYSDGTWRTLDRRINETNWQGTEKRSYAVANSGFYTQYRLLIEDDNDDREGVVAVSMGELTLEACACHYGSELTSVLTGENAAVDSSGNYSNSYPAWHAFDASASSMWLSSLWQTPAWISYEWQSPKFVDQYSITYSNGRITTRAPSVWELQGWNGSAWIAVDSRSGQTHWKGVETRSYTVQSPGSYSKYRLHIKDDNDVRGGIVVASIGNLSLRGCEL